MSGIRGHWPWRVFEILLLAALVASCGLFVSFVDAQLSKRMEVLKVRSIALLEERLDRRISYRSISPSVFGFLAVRELQIFSEQEAQEPLVRISLVKIHYSILRFLVSRDPLQAVSGIHIANTSIIVDSERDRELLDLLRGLQGGGMSLEPPPRFTLSGANIALRYREPGWSVGMTNLYFSISSGAEYYQVSLRCSLEYRRGSPEPDEPSVASRLRMSGKVDKSLGWSDLAVQITALSTEEVSLKRQTFQVTYGGSQLKVNKIQDRAPLDIQLGFDRQSEELTARFTTDRLMPADLIRFSGMLKRYNRWLASSLTGSGEVAYDLRQGTLRYRADVELEPAEGLVPLDIYLASRLYGTEKILYLEPLIVRSPQGAMEFSGNLLIGSLLPSGRLELIDVRSSSGPSLNASLEVERVERKLAVRGERLVLGDTVFNDLSLSIAPRRNEIPFEVSASLADTERSSSVGASGTFTLGRKPALSLEARISGVSLDTLYRLLSARTSPILETRLNPFSASFSCNLATDFSAFTVSSEQVEVFERSNRGNFARFVLEAANDSVEVRDFAGRWSGHELSGLARINRAPNRIDFSSLFVFEDIPYDVRGFYLPERELRVTGSYGLRAAVVFRGQPAQGLLPGGEAARGTAFNLQVANLPIPLKAGKPLLSAELEAFLTRDGSLYMRSPRTSIRNVPYLPVRENTLELAFALQKDRLALSSIAYQDRVSALSGSGNLSFASLSPLGAEGWIRLQGKGTAESYALTAGIRGDELEAALDFIRSPLQRAGELAVSGDLTGSVSVQGSWQQPRIAARFLLQDGKLNVEPLALDAAIGYRDESVTIEALDLSLLTHRLSSTRGQWDMKKGDFSLASKYSFDYFGLPVRMDVALDGTMERPSAGAPLSDLLQKNLDALLQLKNIQVETKKYPDWRIRLAARGGALAVEGGPRDAIHGRIARTGEFTLKLEPPLPVQGEAFGRIRRDQLESSFRIAAVDVRIINTALEQTAEIVRFTKGIGSGELRIAGLITDPDWFGAIDVRDAGMSFQLAPDPIEPINGRLVFNEKTFVLLRTSSYAGKAKVEAEGSFSLDHWIPREFEIAIYVDQYPGVHLNAVFPPVSIDGYGTGAVRVRGDEITTWIEGKITANVCRLTLVRADEPPPPGPPLWVDLKMTVGRSVEFYWPAQNFPVVHTYAKQGDQVALALDGETGIVTLAGNVEIRGGEIFYFDRSFYLRRGNIRFEDTLGEVDPWISALAEIRERDQNNEEIKIYLETNNKLSQFSPRFYSEPSRPDVEILNLIGATIVNRFEEANFGLSAVILTSDIVGQFGILTPFERAVRQILNLDLFSIRTQFLQNLLLGKLMGEGSAGASLNPLDNTTLSLGKYLGTDLFVQAVVRFQAAEAVNAAYNIRTEGELSLEWSTPFFLLEWTFAPRHPENLFLPDNSIGLSWKYSY